jgi:hypothetical protein
MPTHAKHRFNAPVHPVLAELNRPSFAFELLSNSVKIPLHHFIFADEFRRARSMERMFEIAKLTGQGIGL